MLAVILGTLVATILFYYFLIKPHSYWKERGVKQGKPVVIFGDVWGTVFRTQSNAEMVQYIYNQCPGTRYSGLYQFYLPTLILKDPELIKQITIRDFDHFTDHKSFFPDECDPLWSKNLFTLKGQKWHEMRTVLSPSFTSSKMRAMFVLMAECAENFVEYFLKKDEDLITIEMKDAFTRFTNDVIATTAFGIKVDSLAEPNNEFFLTGKKATDFSGLVALKFLCYLLFPKFFEVFKIRFFDSSIEVFFKDLLTETIKLREEKAIVRPDMISLLLKSRRGGHIAEEENIIDTGFATAQESYNVKEKINRKIANDDIIAQALVFFLAGFDSVAALMSFTSYELVANQDVQEKLRKEIQDTLEECKGKLTYEALLKMKYMDMVISETLRKWPVNEFVERVCTKAYNIQPVTPGEKLVHLDEGAVLWLPIFAMHRDPKHYPDPDRFDPERFSDKNKQNIKPYTYFPFGLGPRNCIGSRFALLETKAIFFYLLTHFEMVPVKKTQIPLQLSKKTFNFTAEGGFWYGLKPIKK